jgi:Fe-S-cluster containining protein
MNQEKWTHPSSPALKKVELRFLAHLRKMKSYYTQCLDQCSEPTEYLQKITSQPNLIGLYHELFQRYQQLSTRHIQSQIHCAPHCGNCCHHYPMSVEPFELLHLYSTIRQRSDFASIVQACFERVEQWKHLLQQNEEHLHNTQPQSILYHSEEEKEDSLLQVYFGKQLPCPFLTQEQSCSCYEARPITCRMYLSLSAPEYCTPAHLLTPHNKNFIVYLPGLIEEQIAEVSAYWEYLDLPDSLYEGIVQLNQMESDEVF